MALSLRSLAAASALCLFALACASAPKAAPASPAAAATASATPPPVAAPPSAEAAFREVSARFIAEYLRLNPTKSTTIGGHSHDSEWPDLSAAGEAGTRAFIAKAQAELAAIPAASLDPQNRIDASMLENELASWSFSLDELKEAENNPLVYTGVLGNGLDPLVTRSFAPHAERMRSLVGRLRGVPSIVEAAKARLAHPPKVHTETAIEQNRGLMHLCANGFPEDVAKEPALKADLEAAAKTCAAALADFQTFLEKALLPRSTGDFRLGRARFEKKLRFGLEDDVDIDALAKSARELIARTHEEMYATAVELWPQVLPKEKLPAAATAEKKRALIKKVLDALGADHPDNTTIVPEARRLVDEAAAFVKSHDLVGLPAEECQVIEQPEYRRGVAVAYCDSSGPLEKKQETFYAISPTPVDWPAARVASFYREYNRSMLADVTVHEAMPGHFLQAMHANKFKSDVRAIFSSGPFVEGWAVYGEWLMAKYGFGGAKVRLERQKMILRVCANAILDHGMHAGTMSEKEALTLMMNDAFQEEGEAVGKWRRARLSSAQLTTYYYGFSELMKLREEAEKVPGFSERAYHDKLLSYGSPAVRQVRALMLGR
jgi:uncharacterized protein (DUF885 family)